MNSDPFVSFGGSIWVIQSKDSKAQWKWGVDPSNSLDSALLFLFLLAPLRGYLGVTEKGEKANFPIEITILTTTNGKTELKLPGGTNDWIIWAVMEVEWCFWNDEKDEYKEHEYFYETPTIGS